MFIRSTAGDVAALYLDLLKKCLTDTLRREPDWVQMEAPEHAETMLGLNRVENIQFCLEDTIANGVPGDFVETGVWRGGACIFARAVLRVHGATDRRVWVCDSFRGLPPPNAARYPADFGDKHFTYDNLRISVEQVQENFRRYDLLDDQVVFLEGFFQNTLPTAPIERVAVLRLDGDMYESTIVALDALYEKLSPGGYVIVDDYSLPPAAGRSRTSARRTGSTTRSGTSTGRASSGASTRGWRHRLAPTRRSGNGSSAAPSCSARTPAGRSPRRTSRPPGSGSSRRSAVLRR